MGTTTLFTNVLWLIDLVPFLAKPTVAEETTAAIAAADVPTSVQPVEPHLLQLVCDTMLLVSASAGIEKRLVLWQGGMSARHSPGPDQHRGQTAGAIISPPSSSLKSKEQFLRYFVPARMSTMKRT